MKHRPCALDPVRQLFGHLTGRVKAPERRLMGRVGAQQMEIGVEHDDLVGHCVQDRLHLIAARPYFIATLPQLAFELLLCRNLTVDRHGANDASVCCAQGRAGDTPVDGLAFRRIHHRFGPRCAAECLAAQQPRLGPVFLREHVAVGIAQWMLRQAIA